MNLKKLTKLVKPYLEKNDFGFNHTKRVYNLAIKHFIIPKEISDLTFSSILLHDIGGSSIKEQYKKGPKIAKKILKQLNCSNDFIENVCELITNHHNHPTTPSFSFIILYDSDKLVMFSQEEFPYYNSILNFDWKKIIGLIYTNKVKLLAREFLNRRLKKF